MLSNERTYGTIPLVVDKKEKKGCRWLLILVSLCIMGSFAIYYTFYASSAQTTSPHLLAQQTLAPRREIIIEYARSDLDAFAERNHYDSPNEYNAFHSDLFKQFHRELISAHGYDENDNTVSFSFIVKDAKPLKSAAQATNAPGAGAGAVPGAATPSPVPKWTQLPTGMECFTKYKYGGDTLVQFGDVFGSGYIAELDCYADKEPANQPPEHQMTGCSTIVDTPYFNKDPIYRSGEQIYYNNKGSVYPICSAYHGNGQAIGISARCCKATEPQNYEFTVDATPFTYDWNTYCFNISCGGHSGSGQHMGCTGWVGTEDIGEWSDAFIGNKNHDENGCYTTRHDAKEIVSTQALCGKVTKISTSAKVEDKELVCYDEEATTAVYDDTFGYWQSIATCKYGYDTVDCNSYIDIAIDQCSAKGGMIDYGNNYGGYMIFYQQQNGTPVEGITDGINVCVARGDTEYIRAQANCCKLDVTTTKQYQDEEFDQELEEFMESGGPNFGGPQLKAHGLFSGIQGIDQD